MAGWALKSGGENISIDQQVESIDFKKNPNNTRYSTATEYSIYSKIYLNSSASTCF